MSIHLKSLITIELLAKIRHHYKLRWMGMAAGATPIAFGDFKKAYQIVDRTPLRVLRDPYVNKPFVHFHCTKRVSGSVVESKALRLLKMKSA